METDAQLHGLEFLTAVPGHMRHEVESLFFFNPGQRRLMDKIRVSVEHFGMPEILEEDGRVWIGLRGRQVQCLFAADRTKWPAELAGVVLFVRSQPDCLSILHIAVAENYAHHEGSEDNGIGVTLIREVRRIAHQIKGVRRLELPYQPGRFLPV